MSPKEIRELRESLRLTQQELAVRLGLRSRAAVCHWEAGRKKPTETALILLHQWLREIEKKAGKKRVCC